MFKQVSVMAAAVLVAGSLEGLEAQERPDFSGTWVVERVEFQGPQGNAGGRGRGRGQGRGGIRGGGGGRGRGGRAGQGQGQGRGRGGVVAAPYQEGDRVTLRQTNEALIVTDEGRSRISRYPFDGSEVSNPGPGDSALKSRTSWEGVALVVESTLSAAGPQGDMTLSTREVRSLSQDGSTMTLVATVTMPFGTMLSTVTLVRPD